MKNEQNSNLLLLVSLVLLSAATVLMLDIPDLLVRKTSKKQTSKSIIDKSIKNINQVLSQTSHYNFFTYTSGFENPFRKHGAVKSQPAAGKHSQVEIHVRPKLLLKGVLLKNKSLAIIEDEKGQTYIRGIGETVLDQHIVSINADKVVLRDRKGTYELAVEEN